MKKMMMMIPSALSKSSRGRRAPVKSPRNPLRLCVFVLVCLFAGFGCRFSGDDSSADDGRMLLSVGIEPQAFLVEQIGGDRVRVEVLVATGKDPHHYEATPKKIAALTRSGVFFRTGMPFEETLLEKLKSLAPNLKIVDLRDGLALRVMELRSQEESERDAADRQASAEHRHHLGCSHDGLDPHVWFAPETLKIQAETVLKTLVELDPEGETVYRENHGTFLDKLETLRASLEEKLSPHRGRTVFVFHPSYGYFCDEFGLKQRAIEFEGKSPSPRQLAEIAAEARTRFEIEKIKPIIFVQPEFNSAPAQAVAELIDGRMVEHSCLDRDIFQSMTRFADEIVGE